MSTARKYDANQRSMSPESRRSAYAAININWLQLRPDLHFEDKETIRAERLAWMTSFLQLRRPLASTVELSDKQLGLVCEEMRRMTGTTPKPKQTAAPAGNVVRLSDYKKPPPVESTDAEIEHLAGEAQIFTINKLVGALGWSEQGFRDFLFNKFRRRSPRMLTFKKANSLTMILLNIAADKELRAQGKTKITRKMTAEYIPVLKRKLEIDRSSFGKELNENVCEWNHLPSIKDFCKHLDACSICRRANKIVDLCREGRKLYLASFR